MSADSVVVAKLPQFKDAAQSIEKFKGSLPYGIGQINASWRQMSRLAYHAFTHCNTYDDTYCIAWMMTITLNKTNDLVLAHAFKQAAMECCAVTIRKDNSVKGKLQYYKATRKEELWEEIKGSKSDVAMTKLATAFKADQKDRITGLGYFSARALPQQQQSNSRQHKLVELMGKVKKLSSNDPVLKGKYIAYQDQITMLEDQLSAIIKNNEKGK